ncbi:MAG: DUF362 domain-containing protein [Candidatus Omnitrophica bacterium]|nr:DUF362 domain-containing protein [Candidatus Omnitrophota bacterium]
MKSSISIVKCRTYDRDETQIAVRKAFDLLGGIGVFIKKGEKVLIKPNMLSGKPPEAGVNTHIEIVRAVIRLVKELGAFPFIGDNPGGSVKPGVAYKDSGMLAVAKEEGTICAESKDVKLVRGLPISSYFFDCDKIISLPKMKTHSLMCFTGALKNMFGAVSGLNKTECHKRFPRPEEFVDVILDVFELVKPQLVLMDGVVAMDGDGPIAGKSREVGLLIAGSDSVAVDTVFLKIAGVDPGNNLTIREAGRRGLGVSDIKNIDVLGEDPDTVRIKDFKFPSSKLLMRLPSAVMKILASFIKFEPSINESLCKKCNICMESCPVSCISITDSESKISHSKCIRCMCCHELCPYGAVGLKRNFLARIFGL